MDKINNEMKRQHFDQSNIETATKQFWKTLEDFGRPNFSNKHSHGGSKITLTENDKTVSENQKTATTFNMYFMSVTDSRNLN